jgi:hypothetical protein
MSLERRMYQMLARWPNTDHWPDDATLDALDDELQVAFWTLYVSLDFHFEDHIAK